MSRGSIHRKHQVLQRRAAALADENGERDHQLSAAAYYRDGDKLDPAPIYLPDPDPAVTVKRSTLDALLARMAALEAKATAGPTAEASHLAAP